MMKIKDWLTWGFWNQWEEAARVSKTTSKKSYPISWIKKINLDSYRWLCPQKVLHIWMQAIRIDSLSQLVC